MSTYPKRPKTDSNDTFKRPHSSVEDLEASTQSLSNILNILDTTIKSLDNETAEFSRQTQLALFDRPYELVTENDISIAQTEIGKTIDAELDILIQDSEKAIEDLELEEERLIAKKAEKQNNLDELTRMIKNTETENAAKKSKSKSRPNQAHPFTPQQMQELRKLDNERARLEQLLAYEDRRLAEKTDILIELQKRNLETEKRLESEKNPTPAEIGEYEQGLLKQIDDFKKKIQQRKEEMAERRLQAEHEQQAQAEAEAEADQDRGQQETSNVSLSETIARYRELFDVIEKLQKASSRPDFRASDEAVKECEAELEQFYKDIQQDMAKRKAEQSNQIERLKRLFQVIIPDQAFARTAGRILELLYASDDTKLPLGVLQEEFPEASESRHNFKKVVYWLVSTHIADFDGTHIILLSTSSTQ
ncbi:uncharacterized protein ATC70_000098 [Mucor velutinosus]|uniref:DASH complex subunit SPC19 n=1 Tax=Mucor velutinosus TaxID=708070 RepID=A0AAN7DEL7_9FUNG|nr:hypothetical protein ATC70_000098 [Mucor velutinosus]